MRLVPTASLFSWESTGYCKTKVQGSMSVLAPSLTVGPQTETHVGVSIVFFFPCEQVGCQFRFPLHSLPSWMTSDEAEDSLYWNFRVCHTLQMTPPPLSSLVPCKVTLLLRTAPWVGGSCQDGSKLGRSWGKNDDSPLETRGPPCYHPP